MYGIKAVSICAVYFLVSILSAQGQFEENGPLVKPTCDFAINLLKIAAKEGENTILSPASIAMILSLLQQGAQGNTANEFNQVLGLSADSSRTGYANWTRSLKEKSGGVTFEYGNCMYLKPGLNLKELFKRNVEDSFSARVEELDFGGRSSQDLADTVNRWISQSTHEQIKDVVKPYMVAPDTIMFLVNVMYFKGKWRNRFREKNSREAKFEKSPTESITTAFMYQRNKFYTGRDTKLGVKWIELPFEGDTHRMLFVLPLKRHNLNKVMSKITGEDLVNMINYSDLTDVRLRLPKFKQKGTYSLVEMLQELGLRDVFTQAANLEGISPEPLHVSDAIHQANIEVDERGATASGATILTISRKLILTETYRFDQPFLFFIFDSKLQIPLFAGKIANPSFK